MKNLKIVWILFFVSLLASCTSFQPVPVYTPQISGSGTDIKITDPSSKAKGEAGNIKSRTLVAITTESNAAAAYKAYADAYLTKAEDIRIAMNNNSDIGFMGGVGTLIAGLTGSPNGAAAGALVTTSSSIPSERYNLLVQAANYEKASDTMHCMYRAIAVETANNRLPTLNFLNEMAYQVHRQLRKAQNSVSLVDVDLKRVKESIEKAKESAERVTPATQAVATATQNATPQALSSLKEEDKNLAKEKLAEAKKAEDEAIKADYMAKLELCLSQF